MGGTSFPQSRGGDAGVTAVGSTQYGSPVLENSTVVVSAVGEDVAVQLPASTAGGPPLTVVVVGDASAQVFPPPNGSIQGGAIDAPYEVPLLVTASFVPVTDNDWVVNLSAASSSAPLVRTPEMEAEAAAKRAKEKADAEAAAQAKAEEEVKARGEAERDEADAEARHKAGAKNKRHAVAENA
jgi:hypothetical protein